MRISFLLAILALLSPAGSHAGKLLDRNWGLYNAEADSHVHAPEAWKLAAGGRRVKVAVIDTGVDVRHPELRGRICPPDRDDEYGWDFVENRKNPKDLHGHGTHVAGIVRSVSPTACVIPIRYYSEAASGAQNLANTVKAIDYAVARGAQIINYSGGGAEFSAAEMWAIQRAAAKGVLFVAAAGNERSDVEKPGRAYYPAMYGLPNIIVVTAMNIRSEVLPSSNWGLAHVHVAAPGENIFSTLPNGKYGCYTGTSQATPFVSGIAALVLSKYPRLSPDEVKRVVLESVDRKPSLKGVVSTGGKVNAAAAMRAAKELSSRKLASALR